MTGQVLPGRIETLTDEQELRLKQVWAHLFHFWSIPVDSSNVLSRKNSSLKRSDTVTSGSSHAEHTKKSGKLAFREVPQG